MESTRQKVVIIGSGAIKIGQAGEFDYSGSQAIKALKEEGVETILVNPNIATVQTSDYLTDKIYFTPIDIDHIEKIIEKEKPKGILSGMGGQTALNICSELAEDSVLKKHGVELLGTQLEAIATAEDRDLFRALMYKIKEPVPRSKAEH